MTDARRILVRGRVQGVGFRWHARAEARALGVAGWVRNLADGRVEAHVEGAPDAIDALVDWLGSGPDGAHVEGVESTGAPVEGARSFEIRR